MQKDALERLDLRQMLLEPELLAAVQPDVHLVADLLALKSVLPNKTKETAGSCASRGGGIGAATGQSDAPGGGGQFESGDAESPAASQ